MKGIDVDRDEFDSVVEKLGSVCAMTEIIPIDGKQPVYDYIIVLE